MIWDVCRDRASSYTKAVKEAAPDALEVADRWHLLQNLSAAVEKTCRQHRNCDTDLAGLLASARDRRPNGVLEPFKAYLNARFT